MTIMINSVPLERFVFSGGEVQVKTQYASSAFIVAHLKNSDDIMALLMAVNALRSSDPFCKIYLEMPYVPYARQDRVCDKGEALGAKVFCNLINSMSLERVAISDPHSDVVSALLNNVHVRDQYVFLQELVAHSGLIIKNTVLVSPDAGANKKTLKCAKELGFKEVVRADKIRDVTTGQITGTVAYTEHVGDKDFLIVDDICDGGMTFIELAKVLRTKTNGNIKLFVTHGIFSKGLGVFDGLIDEVYTAYPFDDSLTPYTNLLEKP